MTFNKKVRTFFPPIFGYLTFILCNGLFEKYFPTEPQDDLSTPGIVFLLEYIVLIVWAAIVFAFQGKVIVPKTLTATKVAVIVTFLIGLGIGLVFSFLHYSIDSGTFKEATITFLRVFIQFESFILGNLILITLFNNLTTKSENKQVA